MRKDVVVSAAAVGVPVDSPGASQPGDAGLPPAELSPHSLAARAYLDRCEVLLGECAAMVEALEATLENTPKPSQVLDWSSLW